MFDSPSTSCTPAHSGRSENRLERGFVLVGVVIMVLALTILGLSLFSLSSYEAQFMNRSLDEEQALQSAIGGLDRARFALSVPPDSLVRVKRYLPYENVIYARALQMQGSVAESTNVLIPGGNEIEIRVTAEYHRVRRTISGYFQPELQNNYYKRLLTVGSGGIAQNTTVGPSPPALSSCGTVALADSIWENRPVSTWGPPCVTGTYGVNHRFVEVPLVPTFFTSHAGTNVPGGGLSYNLVGAPNVVSYYRTNEAPAGGFNFSCHVTGAPIITVDGLAVWMLPRGFRSEGQVHIKRGSDPNACLVIVAGDGVNDNDSPPSTGAIWFFGGLWSEIPVILVSDGGVLIEQFNQPAGFTLAPNLSVFANWVVLTGPATGSGHTMSLAYGASIMDPLIDDLMSRNALPNSVSPTPFALRKGSWHVTE